MKIRALIVDDEPWARRRVLSLLRKEDDFEVVAECSDGKTAINAILSQSPEIVFLDIQMPGINGFDVLRAIRPQEWPQIVFVTAYDKYALEAFEIHALDYLLKPFDETRFRRTIRRVREDLKHNILKERKSIKHLLESFSSGPRYLQRLGVKEGGRVIFVKSQDINWFEATGNYIRLHICKESYLIRESMNELETKLDPNQFIRIHRSAIVNLDCLKELQPWFRGEQVLVLKDGTQLTVGRSFRNRLRDLLENRLPG